MRVTSGGRECLTFKHLVREGGWDRQREGEKDRERERHSETQRDTEREHNTQKHFYSQTCEIKCSLANFPFVKVVFLRLNLIFIHRMVRVANTSTADSVIDLFVCF